MRYPPLGGKFADGQSHIQRSSSSQLALFWTRFRHHRLGMLGLIICALLIGMALCAPLITPGVGPDTLHISLTETGANDGTPPTFADFPWRIFGTTGGGLNYSVLAQVTYGARASLTIGVLSALVSSLIGMLIGAVSGYVGGWLDILLMRMTDILLSLPLFPLLILLSAAYGQSGHGLGEGALIAFFGLLAWPGIARQVRSLILTLREREFTLAAYAVGVRHTRIILRHLLPHALPPVLVMTMLNSAGFIAGEATLSFFGLGIDFPPTPTWGNMLAQSQGVVSASWWWALFPSLFLVVLIVALSLIGDALQDTLEVHLATQ